MDTWVAATFYHLARVINDAMNMTGHIFVQVPAFTSFGYIPRSGIARSYVNCMFNFWEITTVAAPFCVPTNSVQGLQFLHILTDMLRSVCFLKK